MRTSPYIVALRRDYQHTAPQDWLSRLEAVPGITVAGASRSRAKVVATEDAVDRVRSILGRWLLIEPVIEHRRM